MGRNNNSKNVRRKRYPIHSFYCPKCGNYNIALPRPHHQRENLHRKMLYCFYCHEDINQVECTSDTDVQKFKKNFRNGVYAHEQ